MKKLIAILSTLILICAALACLASCQNKVDYVKQLKLDMSTTTAKQEVTVKQYIDGDTTHFNVPTSVISGGVLKARYLAIDTPESTGKIEDYGKTASKFTRSKLESAQSIIIESDDSNWNADSTGSRYLVWVWYKPTGETEYRNLNLEILQNGLAIASNVEGNRYGSICGKALDQAKKRKLYVFSETPDPEMYHGAAQELTLKELRLNVQSYDGIKVGFDGVITRSYNNSIYIEEYDEETDMYYGMTAYLGYGLNGMALSILSVGNRVRTVGTVQYYEAGDVYQISGLTYDPFPDDDNADTLRLISKGNKPAYTLTTAEQFTNEKVEMIVNEQKQTFKYAELAMNTSIRMNNLVVKRVSTTTNEESSSQGAMTLTCEVDGIRVSVRTVVLEDENGHLVTEEAFNGKTIDVKGVVDCYNGTYQIKVLSYSDITVHD